MRVLIQFALLLVFITPLANAQQGPAESALDTSRRPDLSVITQLEVEPSVVIDVYENAYSSPVYVSESVPVVLLNPETAYSDRRISFRVTLRHLTNDERSSVGKRLAATSTRTENEIGVVVHSPMRFDVFLQLGDATERVGSAVTVQEEGVPPLSGPRTLSIDHLIVNEQIAQRLAKGRFEDISVVVNAYYSFRDVSSKASFVSWSAKLTTDISEKMLGPAREGYVRREAVTGARTILKESFFAQNAPQEVVDAFRQSVEKRIEGDPITLDSLLKSSSNIVVFTETGFRAELTPRQYHEILTDKKVIESVEERLSEVWDDISSKIQKIRDESEFFSAITESINKSGSGGASFVNKAIRIGLKGGGAYGKEKSKVTSEEWERVREDMEFFQRAGSKEEFVRRYHEELRQGKMEVKGTDPKNIEFVRISENDLKKDMDSKIETIRIGQTSYLASKTHSLPLVSNTAYIRFDELAREISQLSSRFASIEDKFSSTQREVARAVSTANGAASAVSGMKLERFHVNSKDLQEFGFARRDAHREFKAVNRWNASKNGRKYEFVIPAFEYGPADKDGHGDVRFYGIRL